MTEPTRPAVGRALAFAKAGSSAAVSQIAAILLLPILFRIYAPEDFGRWATLQALILATASLSILRYDLAVVTESDERRAGKLFWACIALGGGVAFGAAATAFWFFIRLSSERWDAVTLGLCGVWLLAAVLNQPLQAWLLREGRFGAASASIVMTLAGANAGQLLTAAWHSDYRGLIAGSALGAVFGAGLAAAYCLKRGPPWSGWRGTARLLGEHRRFVTFSLPFTILSLVRERAPILILAAFGSSTLVGAYSQAWRLVHIPAGLAGSALRPVMFHAAARSGAASVGPLVQQIVAGIALLAAPWVGVVVAEPALLFALVLGEDWREAGVFAAILAVPAVLFTLTNWFDRLLDVVQRQDANLKLEIFASVLSVGGFAGLLIVGASVIAATFVQSLGLVAAYLTVLLVAYRICGFPLRPLVRILAAATGLGLLGWLATTGAAAAGGGLAGLFVGGGVALAATTAVALRLLKPLRAAIAGAK